MIFVLVALALVFDFLNGFHDSSNVVATPISSNSMRPRLALVLAAVAHFIAPFLFGVAVATTIGDELLNVEVIQVNVINAALAAAIGEAGPGQRIALVGHEPWMSGLAAQLLTRSTSGLSIDFPKSGIMGIETDGLEPGEGTLRFFLRP
jgi:hypothetical protein